MIERMVVIGVGLIGGSLALALRHAGYCREVIGVDVDREALELAKAQGVIDRYTLEAGEAVQDADMVILATPVGATEAVCTSMRGHLGAQAVLTDVGSVKGAVVEAVRRGLGYLPTSFVPAHPIAGRERSGVAAATSDLYLGKKVILTPLPETAPAACETVARMWEAAGAVTEQMALAHHDEVLAFTSHLPHLLAYTLVSSLSRLDEREEIFRYAASGFRDFTRIASSDPVMWRDICLHNREAIIAAIDHFGNDLDDLKRAVREGDHARLQTLFQRAKQTRDRVCH